MASPLGSQFAGNTVSSLTSSVSLTSSSLGPTGQEVLNNNNSSSSNSTTTTMITNREEEQQQSHNKCTDITSSGHQQPGMGTEPDSTAVSEDDQPIVDIIINNVVCSFNTRCHLNLKKIAMEGLHVEYRRENGMLNMKLRRPNTTASIWSSGKVTCTGATSEDEAKLAARRFARRLQRLGFNVRFINFRIVNVLGTCSLPFGIKINLFSKQYPQQASYEPELHPGVTFKIKNIKATLKVFSTGSITITAPCVANVQEAIVQVYPLVAEFKMEKRLPNTSSIKYSDKFSGMYPVGRVSSPLHGLQAAGLSSSEEEFESDISQD
ncbi:TATA box-binding protein-like 1 [Octopus sinensis]|uniref:TATA box-binding protein-like 1 n=1 Tax=Octopus sinensis TaxID=2607531 RepID=A0A6P7TF39_9MOLL|nr:TATA box-binding protein-like 1 [Octopus sinensis]